jgi:cbb3-type cytochrome oxidase cytochrome c subunit
MEAACAQCHESFNVNKSSLTAYQTAGARDPFAATYLPEMTTIARGQKLFKENACWGCHKIDGYSRGNVGPELTYEGRIATYTSIGHQLWDPKYKVANCVMPYFFSKKIRNVQAQDKRGNLLFNSDGSPIVRQSWVDALGVVRPISTITPADVGSPDIEDSLKVAGFVPDASRQADVDALVTFIVAQTGLNYAQDTSSRFGRISTYNGLVPPTVPVTADEGKLVFNQSGCYSCHYQGQPDNPKDGQGGVFGPNLSWEGSRHSRQWIDQHYANPQAFVPKSIMPVFPFSDSQRAALTLYDVQFIPKGAKPVSPDQDLPTTAMTNDKIVTPEVRYMTR